MNDLRDVVKTLRQEPDDAMLARIRAGVQARIAEPVSPLDVLAAWLRPAAISLFAILTLFAAALSLMPDPVLPGDMTGLAARILIEEVGP